MIQAYPIVLPYNLPELKNQPKLIVDTYTLANIWMGNITKWNDPLLRALNPEIAHLLPDKEIILVFKNVSVTSFRSTRV